MGWLGWGGGSLFHSIEEAYIPNISLLLYLAWKPNFYFQLHPPQGRGLDVMIRLGMWVNSLALEKPTYQFGASYCAWKP